MSQLESYLQEVKARLIGVGEPQWTLEKSKYLSGAGFKVTGLPAWCEGCVDDVSLYNEEDAEFICHSVTDIPKLLAMLEIAVEVLKNLASTPCSTWRCPCCEADIAYAIRSLSKIEEIVAGK